MSLRLVFANEFDANGYTVLLIEGDPDKTPIAKVPKAWDAVRICQAFNTNAELVSVVTAVLDRMDCHMRYTPYEEYLIDVFELKAMRDVLKLVGAAC